MATWLVHIRTAELILEKVPLSRRDFLAGNIAADCGLPDGNGGFDPPKEVTHWTTSGKGHCNYEDFAQKMLPLAHSEQERSFLLGYVSHLITDCLWVKLINNPTKEKFADLYNSDRSEYYRRVKPDWYDNDAAYLASHPDCPILSELSQIKDYDCSIIPYYGRDNVQLQIEHITEFYRTRRYDGREFTYITPAQIEDFILAAAEEVLHRLTRFL